MNYFCFSYIPLSRACQLTSAQAYVHYVKQDSQLGIESVGNIGKDSNDNRSKKSITELPNSLSSQSTVSFLPICMIRYQW